MGIYNSFTLLQHLPLTISIVLLFFGEAFLDQRLLLRHVDAELVLRDRHRFLDAGAFHVVADAERARPPPDRFVGRHLALGVVQLLEPGFLAAARRRSRPGAPGAAVALLRGGFHLATLAALVGGGLQEVQQAVDDVVLRSFVRPVHGEVVANHL